MRAEFISFALAVALSGLSPLAQGQSAPPGAPNDANQPGSEIYDHTYKLKSLQCSKRNVSVYVPDQIVANESFAVISFGHGQALGLDAYEKTFAHLAKKGIAVVFADYDDGFFDQNWTRMGEDFVHLTDCALAQFSNFDRERVIYAGHSKGAYIALIASGIAARLHSIGAPKAGLYFEPAGFDPRALAEMNSSFVLTVVFSDKDTVVSRDISEQIYRQAPSLKKQFITLRSYNQTSPALDADHFWPLTESTFFGGHETNAFQYYGEWKWLTAAAQDLTAGNRVDNPYVYGSLTTDKGIQDFKDDLTRSW